MRSVVASATTGDTIDLSQLACGTITLLSGQVEVHVPDLTIAGPGQKSLTIDGNDNGRVLLHDGAGTLTLSGVTLTHGKADSAAANPPASFLVASGGCVLSSNYNGSVALIDATVTSCEAIHTPDTNGGSASGGGIWAVHLSLTRSIVSDNTVTGIGSAGNGVNVAGGGVYSWIGPATLVDSVVSGNRATTGDSTGYRRATGGGIYARHGVDATGSTIENNFAGCDTAAYTCSTANGGGIYVSAGGAHLTLASSVVSNNRVVSSTNAFGGGVYANNSQGTPQFTGTTISGNSAISSSDSGKGGGLFFWDGSPIITSSTISGNSATTSGGGIFSDYNRLTVTDSTVSGNSAASGGGLFLGNSSGYGNTYPMAVSNSTITANVASGAVGGGGVLDTHTNGGPSTLQSTIVAGNTASLAAANADLGANLPTVGGANDLIVAAAGLTLPAGTLSADPLLGPLQDNGGPTFTHALLAGSPAVDAGNNAANLPFDQRGSGYPRVSGAAADIGAFESAQTFSVPTLIKSFVPSGIVPGGTSTLTITLGNANAVAGSLTADLVDALPAPVVIASTPNAVTTCSGGIVAADSGAASVTLGAGAEIPPAGSCTVTVSVTANAEGDYTNTIPAGALQTNFGGNTDPAVASLTVSIAADQPPVAVDDYYTVRGNTTLTVASPGILGNDYDPDGDLIAVVPGLVGSPSGGGIVGVNYVTGAFTYTPPFPSFVGTDSFTYVIEDSWFTFSNTATVWITVTAPPNQPPVAMDDSYAVPMNTTLTVDAALGVLANDSDPDGDPLTAAVVNAPANGTLLLYPDGHLVYVPHDGFIGTYQFTYRANDGFEDSNIATVTITVGDVDNRIFADGFDGQ